MAEQLNDKEFELVKKSITAPDRLTNDEKEKLDYIKAKPIRVDDVIKILGIEYPIPTGDEMDLTKRLVESQGTMKVNKEENDTLDAARVKRASLQDVVDIVMSAYKGSLANRYRDLKNELFLVQIMVRDFMVSKPELKKLAKKLHDEGDLSDEGLKTINASKLVMGKADYKKAAKTREDAYTKVVDQMNEQSAKLDAVQNDETDPRRG